MRFISKIEVNLMFVNILICLFVLGFLGWLPPAYSFPNTKEKFEELKHYQQLDVDREQLINTLREEAINQIVEGLQAKAEELKDAALNRAYQEIKNRFQAQFGKEIKATKEYVEQFLNGHPRIDSIVKDYQEGKSKEILSQLNELVKSAKEELDQILELNKQYENEGEKFESQYKELLNKYGIKGRWVDKIAEWEELYHTYGADKVELAQMLYEGFEGGQPGGQLVLLFDLMEKYSDKVPVLGRFIKMYAQIGKEMLNAAIRAGELIRKADQGCLGVGAHGGFKNWYNLGDPINIKFNEMFPQKTACPTAIDYIFEDVEDNAVLYFWKESTFLVGASGNGGMSAIFAIREFLLEVGMKDQLDDAATVIKFYNSNFPRLKQQAEQILSAISKPILTVWRTSARFVASLPIINSFVKKPATCLRNSNSKNGARGFSSA
jgi:hypothetical protein